ncbi:flavin-containing monooxygenase [Mycolicibacterium neworleansense]|uniref:Potassium transport flavoprotein n=1 Tax=Mycolicibacterium neworleansense TaxID=146018 RepID=A0A0H5RSD8_9MYCO|nr:NAD(P)-binding domain-containing protein [Mycolicibacterium neworleansense]MCV7365692.1 NAD(P)-binding domain-containing protein [Mycolicibacterium neworleansense]CRZ16392.1 potassium transport flavoprotein [Mycolicibacterium neworleansense]
MSNGYIETVIIGAGQQGCGVAGALQELGHEAIVFEKGEVGQRWAHERWDSLLVGSGNRSIRLPGWDYDGDDPLALPSGPQVAGHLRRYVRDRDLTVREHTPVQAVEGRFGVSDDDMRFRTRLHDGETVESRNLVAALGGYAQPRKPILSCDVDSAIHQTHSSDYRNPGSLPGGAVLVVGAGISGQQIADELIDAGRRVFLSVGRHRAWPRHYRGRTIHEWMHVFSLYDDFVAAGAGDSARLPGLPVCGNRLGTAELNLGTLAEKGVVLVGSARGARGSELMLEDNVVDVAEESALTFREVINKIDTGLRDRGFVAPAAATAPAVNLDAITGFGTRLDLARHGISTIVWCTGFRPDYRILPAQALDENGAPLQRGGILGALPGLYYAGLPDGNSLARTGLAAVADNGRFIAGQIHADHVMRTKSSESLIAAV